MPRQEGYSLRDVRVELNGSIVGGIQSMTVERTQENTVYDEAGSANPLYIQDGSIRVSGTVEKLMLDMDFIKDNFDLEEGINPYFNLIGINKKTGDAVVVEEAKFKGFSLTFGINEGTMNSLPYDALRAKVR